MAEAAPVDDIALSAHLMDLLTSSVIWVRVQSGFAVTKAQSIVKTSSDLHYCNTLLMHPDPPALFFLALRACDTQKATKLQACRCTMIQPHRHCFVA